MGLVGFLTSCSNCKPGKWFPTSFKYCPYCGRRIILTGSSFVTDDCTCQFDSDGYRRWPDLNCVAHKR